jgi:hypothetical protein
VKFLSHAGEFLSHAGEPADNEECDLDDDEYRQFINVQDLRDL